MNENGFAVSRPPPMRDLEDEPGSALGLSLRGGAGDAVFLTWPVEKKFLPFFFRAATLAGMFISRSLGTTPEGRPLEFHCMGPSDPWILFLGGVHGDEIEGVWLMEEAVRRLAATQPAIGVGIWPRVNPDGVAKEQRWNASHVDLNRNLPSKDWTAEVTNPKYPPGPSAGSEVENQALLALLRPTPPRAILSAHSFHKYQVNVNGPAQEWGARLAELCGYPVTEDIGYPTPGCLGTYTGKELGIPTITLEIERGLPRERVLALHFPLIEATVSFWSQPSNHRVSP